jgi:hypothetical protein
VRNQTREDIARERAELRARFGDAYARLEALLFEEDPIGINYGHNRDEYSPEVRTILPRLETCGTVDEVQHLVHAEFTRWFQPHDAGPLERYRRIAERICAELPELLS